MSVFSDLMQLNLHFRLSETDLGTLRSHPKFTALKQALEEGGILPVLVATDDEVLKCIQSALLQVCNALYYYHELNLHVSPEADLYLNDAVALYKEKGCALSLEDLSRMIGKARAKDPRCVESDGIRSVLNLFHHAIDKYKECLKVGSYDLLDYHVRTMEYANTILHTVDTCLLSQSPEETVMNEEITIVDTDVDAPVLDTDGEVILAEEVVPDLAQVEHIGEMIEGAEAFLNRAGNESLLPSQHYLTGVMYANGDLPMARDGNEGKIIDAIKAGAMKVWTTITNALKSVKEFFFGKKDEEMAKVAVTKAEAAKAKVKEIKDKTVEISESVRDQLKALADKVDVQGKFKALIERAKTIGDIPLISDGLLGLMQKEVQEGCKLHNLYNAAEAQVNKLKAVIGKIAGVKDEDKEGQAAVREESQAEGAEAKEKFNIAKAALKAHTTAMSALKSAVEKLAAAVTSKDSSSTAEA